MQRWLVGMLTGSAVGAVAILVVVGAAGAGHGTYVPAALCFPFTMAISALEKTIHPASVALALIQFPTYGLLIGCAAKPSSRAFLLACVHAGSAFLTLLLMMSHGSFW